MVDLLILTPHCCNPTKTALVQNAALSAALEGGIINLSTTKVRLASVQPDKL